MPRSFRNELDAFMRSQTEQIPEWHEAMSDERATVPDQTALVVLNEVQGIHRQAILLIADEIDRLLGTVEPES